MRKTQTYRAAIDEKAQLVREQQLKKRNKEFSIDRSQELVKFFLSSMAGFFALPALPAPNALVS